MKQKNSDPYFDLPKYQLEHFKGLIRKLFQCCQERMRYQTERFNLPDAELRCLLLFADERYLTAKSIAQKMAVVKSRVTKIVKGLIDKKLIQSIKDPEDSRISLLSLAPRGQAKIDEINEFLDLVHREVLVQMTPEQRKAMLANMELLNGSMEAAKALME